MGSSWRLGTTLWLWQRLSSSPSSEGTPSTRLWGWLRHEHQRGTTSTRRGRGVSGRSVRASPYSVTGHAEPPLPHAHSEGEWAVPSFSSVNKSFCQPSRNGPLSSIPEGEKTRSQSFCRYKQAEKQKTRRGNLPKRWKVCNETHKLMRNNENSCVSSQSGKLRTEDQIRNAL